MKKYSAEWKREQMNKAGGWAQKHEPDRHGNRWRWHYIQHETECTSRQAFTTMRECAGANGHQ